MAAHQLKPFIDSSCRREPDFESPFPSISGLCRVDRFAPRLHVGDQVAYMTCKIKAAPRGAATRYLVAILQVVAEFKDHDAAAEWYESRALPLPSNCHVAGNAPQPYEKTAGIRAQDRETYRASEGPATILRNWDEAYAKRARQYGAFLACRALHRALTTPPELSEADIRGIFGRIPGTQTPPRITGAQMGRLLEQFGD